MLREAAQAGHIVWKEGDGQQIVFAWTKDWLGHKLETSHDYQSLVKSYLHTYGPVEAADLAAWLGVTVAAARKLMAKHLVEEVEVEGEGAPTFMKREDLDDLLATRKSKAKGLVVVPPGDPFLIAYKTRFRPGGEGAEDEGAVLVDGRTVAGWSLIRGAVTVRVLDETHHRRAEKAVRDLIERAGVEAEVQAQE